MAKPLHPLLQPFKPTESDPFDYTKAAHLLQRAGFGGTHDEILEVMALGPEKAVDRLMTFPDAPIDEQGQGIGPDLSSVEGYPSDFAQIRKLYEGKSQEERQEIRQRLQRANREAVGQTMGWWLERMAKGPFALQEKLTLFWHGHFTTSARDERQATLMWNQNELHRRLAAGNFRTYVQQIARDPAMLDYLNNAQNRKAHPNENFARELMELFTLGRDQYTEDDIKEAARAFTGWAHDGDDFVFRARDHDADSKTFMGLTGNFDGDDIIEIILKHRSCAPYIASRFWNFFVYEPDSTDEAMLASLGNLLRESNWEMRPLIRTMLTSRAFYSPRAVGTQIKSPIQLVVGTIRMLGINTPPYRSMISQLSQMGQVPLSPPNVKGWPGGRLWINTSTLFVRYNTGVWLTGGEIPALVAMKGKGIPNPAQGAGKRQGNKGSVDLPASPLDPSLDTAEKVADYWVTRLVQRPIESEKRTELATVLGNRPRDGNNIRKLIQLIVSMPDYQLC